MDDDLLEAQSQAAMTGNSNYQRFGVFFAPPPSDKELRGAIEGPPDLFTRTTERNPFKMPSKAEENEEKEEENTFFNNEIFRSAALVFGGMVLNEALPTIRRALSNFENQLNDLNNPPQILDPVFVEDDDMPDLVDLALP